MFAIQNDYTLKVGDKKNCKVDLQGQLDADESELLTGTPTVTESTGEITITNVARNAASMTVDGVTVPIDMGVKFRIDAANGVADKEYCIEVTCPTTNGQDASLTLVVMVTAK